MTWGAPPLKFSKVEQAREHMRHGASLMEAAQAADCARDELDYSLWHYITRRDGDQQWRRT